MSNSGQSNVFIPERYRNAHYLYTAPPNKSTLTLAIHGQGEEIHRRRQTCDSIECPKDLDISVPRCQHMSPGIVAWLAKLHDTCQDFETPVTPTRITRKRKLGKYDHPRKHSPLYCPRTDTMLTEVPLNMLSTPSPSVAKRARKKVNVSKVWKSLADSTMMLTQSCLKSSITPQTDQTISSYEAASRPVTGTLSSSSSSSSTKQTPNEHNVRVSMAEHGLWFENLESFNKYPEFEAKIAGIVFADRDSAMRIESIKACNTWRAENATRDEKTYFAGQIPRIIKDERSVGTLKRTFQDEIIYTAKDWKEDGLVRREDCLFVQGSLPLRTSPAQAAEQGVTNPKPDVVFGLKHALHPPPDEPMLSNETKAVIGVAPEIEYPFFSVENKGAQKSIEAAENQAIRSGAAMAAAIATLRCKAHRKLELLPPQLKDNAVYTSAFTTDLATASDPTTSDTSVIAADATIDTIAPPQQANETNQKDCGADMNSFVFTCSWVPQMANLHVNWIEHRPEGKIYHMSHIKSYLMCDPDDLRAFRRHIHNVLDWGISTDRKTSLKEQKREIAGHEGRDR